MCKSWVGSVLMREHWSESEAWVHRQETWHSPALPQLRSWWNTNCREVRVDAHGTEKLPRRTFYVHFFSLVRDKQSLFGSATCAVLIQFVSKAAVCLFFSWDSVVTSKQWTFSQLPFSALMYWFRHYQLSINFAFVWEELKRVNKRNFSKLHSQTALIFSAALSLLSPMFLFATKLSTNWVIF